MVEIYAVAFDPVAERVLLNTGDLVAVEDYVDGDLSSVEADQADCLIYAWGDDWLCTDISGLTPFTVH